MKALLQCCAWVILCAAVSRAEDKPTGVPRTEWEPTLTKTAPGAECDWPDFEAVYTMGWSGVPAARVEVKSAHKGTEIQLDASGATVGLARTLWKLDFTHSSRADATSLWPIAMKQEEIYRKETKRLAIAYARDKSVRTNEEVPGDGPKTRTVKYADLRDMHSALLYLRSRAFAEGDVTQILVLPGNAPSLAAITYKGKEEIQVMGEKRMALRFDLGLKKINKLGVIEEQAKFRRASAWFSDDRDRIPLRIEGEVFIGVVFAELESIHLTKPGESPPATPPSTPTPSSPEPNR